MKSFKVWFCISLIMFLAAIPAMGTEIKDSMTFSGDVTFKSTVKYGDTAYTYPSTDGTVGQHLATDGAGTLS